ncbi:MAG: tyrosine-type recombinase/integrase [Phycisphaerae bacterium]|nr:tyrosine-type recombinase/integrase [Phycisphaerae bacterium]
MPITELAIKNAKLPEKGTITIWDDKLKGFGCRISNKGTRTWIVLIASGRRQSIGRFPLVSLADARKEAKGILAQKMLGTIRPTYLAFDEAKKEFLAECEKKNRPSTYNDYKRILGKHYPFGTKAIGDITPQIILRQIRTLDGKPTRKRYAFAVGRAFFNWCIRQHIIDRSPMEKLEPPKSTPSRERILSPEELYTLREALKSPSTPFKRIALLLLLTGQRRGEISRLEWDWIENDTITIPSSVTKNKRTHAFPCGPWVRELLKSIPREKDCPYLFPASRKMNDKTTVFNGWGKPKAALDEETGLSNWTLHDLRRTLSSYLAGLGVQQIVVEKLLNHVSGGSQSPIAQVYNRYLYLEEMRDAVLKWENYLLELRAEKV